MKTAILIVSSLAFASAAPAATVFDSYATATSFNGTMSFGGKAWDRFQLGGIGISGGAATWDTGTAIMSWDRGFGLGLDGVDLKTPCDGVGGRLVVACRHNDVNTRGAEGSQRVCGGRLDGIGYRKDRLRLSVDREENRRGAVAPGARDLGQPVGAVRAGTVNYAFKN